EILKSYRAAQQAIANQVTVWMRGARTQLTELEQGLEQRMRDAGVAEANILTETPKLLAPLQAIHERLDQPTPGLAEARGVLTAVANAAMNLQQQLQSLGLRYEIERRVGEL